MSDTNQATCRSNHHDRPEAAVVVGVFDCSAMNGNPPQPQSHYCLRCAVILHTAGFFTPTDGTELPTAERFLDTVDRAMVEHVQGGATPSVEEARSE